MGRPKQFDPDIAIDQAMELFWRKGYAATTPQELTEALGVGKGSLYNAFGSKRALFELALRRYRDSQSPALAEILQGPGTVKDRLRQALHFLVDLDLADPDRRGCMVVNTATELAGSDETATELVRQVFNQTEGAFRELIEEGLRSGEISSDRDPLAVGSLLLNTTIGLRVIGRVSEGPDRLVRVVDAIIDAL